MPRHALRLIAYGYRFGASLELGRIGGLSRWLRRPLMQAPHGVKKPALHLSHRTEVLRVRRGRRDQFSDVRGAATSGDGSTMPAGGRLVHLARTRQRYSGESLQYAKNALQEHRELPLLPDADGEQARLEASVLEKLGWPNGPTVFPMGLIGTYVSPEDSTVVLEGGPPSGVPDDTSMPLQVLDKLLPHAHPDDETRGVAGLRVAGIKGSDLQLRRVGTNASVTLRGATGTDWRQLLADHEQELIDRGATSLWTEPTTTVHEHDTGDSWSDRLAWLGSPILRRVALFESASAAFHMTSWTNLDTWIFELELYRYRPFEHDALVEHLTDDVWGLPLKVSERRCRCAEASNDLYTPSCTINLDDRITDRGTMQLRFVPPSEGFRDREAAVAERRRRLRSWPSWKAREQ